MRYLKLCAAIGMAVCMNMAVFSAYAAEPEPVLYGIGSVSKMYTTAAVMKLSEEGRLDLDTPLTVYIPEFTMKDERYGRITPRMLLNHTSGLQGSIYTNSMTLGGSNEENHDLILERLKEQRLKAEPGSFAVYCNDGFTLAEILIERVTGETFTDYIKHSLAEPLGIKQLETPRSSFDRNRLAGIYVDNEKELPYESANLLSSGGIYSTAEDVCRFFSIFTKAGYGKTGAILSEQSVKTMAEPEYKSEVWKEIPAAGSSVAYGLGWDTAAEYPFAGYGIKALSKGGDTTAYHAAVTVLPEENVSCAVLTSGGKSMSASLAVQSILKEYLVEKGRISKEQSEQNDMEAAVSGTATPDSLKQYEGWYASGMQMMKISFMGNDTLSLENYGTDHHTAQTYTYSEDGRFYSTGQDYLDLSGTLLAAEGGVRGRTSLRLETDGQGQEYIIMDTVQYQPGIGATRVAVPFAQKMAPSELPQNMTEVWEAYTAEDYLLASEAFNSAMYLNSPSATLYLNPEIPGYLGLKGVSDSITKITDESHAGFFQQIPGHAGRDLNDITVTRNQGIITLDNQIYRFVNAGSIPDWDKEKDSIAITEEGAGQWYDAGEDRGIMVTVTAPENGHFYIYRKSRDGMVLTASSVTGDSERPIYLPESCRILFAGEQGAVFQIRQN